MALFKILLEFILIAGIPNMQYLDVVLVFVLVFEQFFLHRNTKSVRSRDMRSNKRKEPWIIVISIFELIKINFYSTIRWLQIITFIAFRVDQSQFQNLVEIKLLIIQRTCVKLLILGSENLIFSINNAIYEFRIET